MVVVVKITALAYSSAKWGIIRKPTVCIMYEALVNWYAQCLGLGKHSVYFSYYYSHKRGLPRWHSGKESLCQCKRHRNASSIPGLARCPGVGNGKPLQYSCLENSTDRGVWQAAAHRVAKSQRQMDTHSHKRMFSHSLCTSERYKVPKTLGYQESELRFQLPPLSGPDHVPYTVKYNTLSWHGLSY